jgi:hypothetical protein
MTCHLGQKYFLNQEYLPVWSMILFLLSSQCFGFGLAGICRRYLVRPAAIIWPGNLSVIAVLNSLFEESDDTSKYKTSRFKFYLWACFALAVYQFIPSYFAPIFKSIALLCILAPASSSNSTLKLFGSPYEGLGIFSFTLDWTYASYLARKFVSFHLQKLI